MEPDIFSNPDDSQSNISSPSTLPDNSCGLTSSSSHNSVSQSLNNNTSGSRNIDFEVKALELNNNDEDDDPDSSSSKSKIPVAKLHNPEYQLDNELQISSLESSLSSGVSSTAGTAPDRNIQSNKFKVLSRNNESDKVIKEYQKNYLLDVFDELSLDNLNYDDYTPLLKQKNSKDFIVDIETNSLSKRINIPLYSHNNVNVSTKPNKVDDLEEALEIGAEYEELFKDETESEEKIELEEGEHRAEEIDSRPKCKFYFKGKCTRGTLCRFSHSDVANKKHYSIFKNIHPQPSINPISYYINDIYKKRERKLISKGQIAHKSYYDDQRYMPKYPLNREFVTQRSNKSNRNIQRFDHCNRRYRLLSGTLSGDYRRSDSWIRNDSPGGPSKHDQQNHNSKLKASSSLFITSPGHKTNRRPDAFTKKLMRRIHSPVSIYESPVSPTNSPAYQPIKQHFPMSAVYQPSGSNSSATTQLFSSWSGSKSTVTTDSKGLKSASVGEYQKSKNLRLSPNKLE